MGNTFVVGAVIHVSGIVQGVGFRPFVYRQASQFRLKGSVRNTGKGVLINVDGARQDIEGFYNEIRSNPPVLAEIHSSSLHFTEPAGFDTFTIRESLGEGKGFTPISPDIAACAECLADISLTENRRYRYPFTNCTNCGPRFTIIRSIPYDRSNTTMSVFPMCSRCAEEYKDPGDRRYHAQPNACPECGPSIRLLLPDGLPIEGDPITESVELLNEGKILAIKGLGGYHLAADPFNCEAIRLLRERKQRPGKPFALMARDLAVVKKYCKVSDGEGDALGSNARPILLLEKTEGTPGDPTLRASPAVNSTLQALPPGEPHARNSARGLCAEVAPDTSLLGVMLPYTPLHHLLLEEGPELLVMTSGNLSEEPLAYKDEEAFSSLSSMADAFLTHDREIERPCDDSVFMSAGEIVVPIRRSRGYVPRAIDLAMPDSQVLAAGASEKNTFCVFKGGRAFLSHHVGDLNNEKSIDAYVQGIEDFLEMFRVSPEAVACDLHPDYMSTRFAEERAGALGVPLFRVQHHHAHIASLLGEKGIREKVIGVAFDGTGYGPDGTIWGGEFLVADAGEYERVGHFAPVPMPGGEKSILEIDRMGVSYLLAAYGAFSSIPEFPFIEAVGEERLSFIEKVVRSGLNCPLTSSCGRLFDAVSSLVGLCTRPSYDAQGAILLETAAGSAGHGDAGRRGAERLEEPYPYRIEGSGAVRFDEMIRAIVEDLIEGRGREEISRRFHSTIVDSGVEICKKIREERGISVVALSGGAFQNRILLRHFNRDLERAGFSVLVHALVPPNDGGISLGQGVVALTSMERGNV